MIDLFYASNVLKLAILIHERYCRVQKNFLILQIIFINMFLLLYHEFSKHGFDLWVCLSDAILIGKFFIRWASGCIDHSRLYTQLILTTRAQGNCVIIVWYGASIKIFPKLFYNFSINIICFTVYIYIYILDFENFENKIF